MISKLVDDIYKAISPITDGSTIAIGGFGGAGQPEDLINTLIEHGAKDLTIVSNNAGNHEEGIAALLKAGQVKKIICSFPRMSHSYVFDELYKAGKIELELVPQGNLAERLRASGVGLGAIYTPTGYGTLLAENKKTMTINGRNFVLEYPIEVDFSLIKAELGDRWGNLTYRKAARNFGPIMAMAAKHTIVSIEKLVPLGELDPEHIITPGIFVKSMVCRTPVETGVLA